MGEHTGNTTVKSQDDDRFHSHHRSRKDHRFYFSPPIKKRPQILFSMSKLAHILLVVGCAMMLIQLTLSARLSESDVQRLSNILEEKRSSDAEYADFMDLVSEGHMDVAKKSCKRRGEDCQRFALDVYSNDCCNKMRCIMNAMGGLRSCKPRKRV